MSAYQIYLPHPAKYAFRRSAFKFSISQLYHVPRHYQIDITTPNGSINDIMKLFKSTSKLWLGYQA